MFRNTHFIKNRGFTLLEVVAAIFLLLVGMTGVFAVINNTIKLMASSPYKLTAAYLAQEGIEVVRNIRDTNLIMGLDWKDLDRAPASSNEQKTCPDAAYVDVAFDTDTLRSPFPVGQCNDISDLNTNLFLVTFDGGVGTFYVPGNAGDRSDSACTVANSEDWIIAYSKETPFERHIEICYEDDADGIEYMQVKSVVTWQVRGKDYEIIAEDNLYDWY